MRRRWPPSQHQSWDSRRAQTITVLRAWPKIPHPQWLNMLKSRPIGRPALLVVTHRLRLCRQRRRRRRRKTPIQPPTTPRPTSSPRPPSRDVTLRQLLLRWLLLRGRSQTSTSASSACASTRPVAPLIRPPRCWPLVRKSLRSGWHATLARTRRILRRHGRHHRAFVFRPLLLQPTKLLLRSSLAALSRAVIVPQWPRPWPPLQTRAAMYWPPTLEYAPPGRLVFLLETHQHQPSELCQRASVMDFEVCLYCQQSSIRLPTTLLPICTLRLRLRDVTPLRWPLR
mmetsp:Transcript_30404/g.76070  ORF Transcript_30404/g.76070 Transcript_30404/m.76070 type:complete len:284 (-) Transcript_30404:381-1232(-)